MSTVVVTGGTGFIGQSVCMELSAQGHTAIPFDHALGDDVLTTPIPEADAVVHLAGVLGTAELFDTPDLAVDVNIKGTLRVLEACAKHKMGYVGITQPQVWRNVYQATKGCARDLASAWHRYYGVPVSHVRAFNVFGPEQKHGPSHPQKIIPTFASLAWQDRPIPIWGDGTQTVDLIHVDDVAKVMVEALGVGDDSILDAGSGRSWSVNDVARFVLNATASTGGILYHPMRKGEHPVELVAQGEGRGGNWRIPTERLVRQLNETIMAYKAAAEIAA